MFKEKGEMNRTISENSMIIDGVSHERNIRVWVRNPNATTVYKRASYLLIPPKCVIHRDEIYFKQIPKPLRRMKFLRIDEKQLLR